jgi:4a-hydroxytetrahydrobiopterin dehydratase
MKLSELTCQACHANAPSVTDEELVKLISLIPHWHKIVVNEVMQLERVFTFKDFALALVFTNKVGALAEADFHHPSILTQWGEVTVTWWTHAIDGLHKNDFIMAAKTDELLAD